MSETPDIDSQLRALNLERQQVETDLERLIYELGDLADKPELSDGDEQRFDRINRGASKLKNRLVDIDTRQKSLGRLRLDQAMQDPSTVLLPGTNLDPNDPGDSFDRDPGRNPRDVLRPRRSDPWRGLDGFEHSMFNQLSTQEARSRAYDAISYASGTTNTARESMAKAIEDFDDPSGSISRWVLHGSHPDYTSAFWAYMRGDEQFLTDAEIRAVRRVRDVQRAMSLTDAAGGFMIPAQLDPSIYITGAGNQSDISRISRNVIATGDVWTGVSSAQISASWDAEAAEVSDDAPTLAAPSVSVHKSAVFIPFSIEVGMDAANFSQEMTKMMVDSQSNLEATAFATGSGSGQPFGIVTALTGGASELSSAATDTFALADIYALFDALPARHKDAGTWLANDAIYTLIRQMDTTGGAALWTYLADEHPQRLIGRPAASSSAMDGTVTALAENYVLILGAFADAYVIARRIGFTVETIPHLFATGANRPSGQRGFYGFARLGADSIADDSFRMLNCT